MRGKPNSPEHAGVMGAALALALAICATTARASAPVPVEYLLAEANEGGSSGGHVALRLGAEVFHFQQQEGLLRLLRTDLRDFLHEYALAGNRNVRALRLDVSEDTAARLLAGFAAQQRAASRQLDRLAALRADRQLLEQALSDAAGAPRQGALADALSVPAAGFFVAAAPAPACCEPAPALERLRARVEDRYGAGFVAARLAEVGARRARLAPFALPPLEPLRPDSEPALLDAYASRHADLAAAQTALEVLRDATPLREGSAVLADPDAPRLGAPERRALCGFREGQAEELARLAGSRRPDWGRAFLLGAARLLALEASCERGRLLVLDAFADADAPSVEAPQPRALALLQRDADAALARARRRLLEGSFSARRLSDLETSAGRAAELRRAARLGALRVPEGRLVPGRPAPRIDLPRAPVSRAQLEAVLAQARLREREAQRAIESLHAYHLTRHNCVTEIFRTVNRALGDARGEIEARLGGYLDPDAPGLFVPFVSASALRARYRVVAERSIPSLRAARVARLAAQDGRLLTALRELSPLTARSYARTTADSPFLFFGDAVPALRPLFGAANLAVGTGEALVGLAGAPFDGGRRLGSGLRGMLWSLPELFFVSVRKGTHEYVEPEWSAWLEGVMERSYAASTTTAIDASVSGAPSRQ